MYATKEQVEEIMKSEVTLEALAERVVDEMNNDDEALDERGRQLLIAYLDNPSAVDDVLIALCGWSVKSLIGMVMKGMSD